MPGHPASSCIQNHVLNTKLAPRRVLETVHRPVGKMDLTHVDDLDHPWLNATGRTESAAKLPNGTRSAKPTTTGLLSRGHPSADPVPVTLASAHALIARWPRRGTRPRTVAALRAVKLGAAGLLFIDSGPGGREEWPGARRRRGTVSLVPPLVLVGLRGLLMQGLQTSGHSEPVVDKRWRRQSNSQNYIELATNRATRQFKDARRGRCLP